MTDTTPPEGVHLDPDGTARIVTPAAVVTLRRPTLIEYSDLADLAQTIDSDVASKRPRLIELSKAVTSGSAHDIQRAEAGQLTRSIRFAHRPLLERIVELLGRSADGASLDLDSSPSWLGASSREISARLLDHWENVPFHGSATSGN